MTGEKGFEHFTTNLLELESQDSSGVRRKANAFVKKMYPFASFALSIVSIGSTAAGIVPLTVVVNALDQICIGHRSSRLDDSRHPDQTIIVDAIKLLTAMTGYIRTNVLYLKSCWFGKLAKTAFSENNVVTAEKDLDEAAEAFHKICGHAADLRILESSPKWKEDGKTVLTAVVDWVKAKVEESPVLAVSYAYCEYDASKEDQEAISILKSIARQLVEWAPRSQRSRLIKETRDFLKHLGPEKSPTLEVDFLTSVTSMFQQAIVVINALDECPSEIAGGETNRSTLVKWLRAIPKLKLLITSHDIPAIRTALDGSKVLPMRPSWTSIQTYLTQLIDDRKTLLNNVARSRDLRTQIDDAVKSRFGEPIFITARLLIEFVSPLPLGEIKDILKSAAEASKKSTIGDAHGSSGTHLSMSDPTFWYRLLIDRIKDRKDEGIQILAWVSCANRRLSVEEL
ncbi:hypothetical protein QQX98_003779 [Neonectria punicea]|uniref:Nephrocystin 3-like N-terminal domain-containing protein n=1 Tax=Neonectria punicea TaxID=979145 RepID=A0ABR1HC79_9HYPO